VENNELYIKTPTENNLLAVGVMHIYEFVLLSF